MSAPHSAEASAGKSCPHFPNKPMCSGAQQSHFTAAEVGTREQASWTARSRLQGPGDKQSVSMQTKEKKWDLGWWAWASSASSQWALPRNVETARTGGVPARTHQWLLQGPWTDSCCRRLGDNMTSLPRRALMSWPWEALCERKNCLCNQF